MPAYLVDSVNTNIGCDAYLLRHLTDSLSILFSDQFLSDFCFRTGDKINTWTDEFFPLLLHLLSLESLTGDAWCCNFWASWYQLLGMNSAEYNLYFLLLFNAESTIHGGSFSLIFYVAFVVYTLFQFFKLYSYSTYSLQMIYIGAGILEIVARDFVHRNDLIQALVLKIFSRYLLGNDD